MNIKFSSEIDNKGKKNLISFVAPVTISKYNEFDVYEFVEPSKNEMNRIEVSDQKVNIMTGPSTIELELKNSVDIFYQVANAGMIKFTSYLEDVNRSEQEIKFKYNLKNKNEIIGIYNIKLEIMK